MAVWICVVDRLERELDAVAPGVGTDMVIERRRRVDSDMLLVVDVSAEEEETSR
jgi:hypothetical protein